MIKRDELSDPSSCLNTAAEDEPLFVLRANDELAPEIIRVWITRSIIRSMHLRRLEEAELLAQKMEAWKLAHPGHTCVEERHGET